MTTLHIERLRKVKSDIFETTNGTVQREDAMKILIAVDGSACSTKATKHAALHQEWFRDTLTIHLVNVQVPIGPYRTRGLLSDADVADFYHQEAMAALAPSERLLRRRLIGFQSAYMVGRIDEKLKTYVKKHKIDLVVMGSAATNVLATASVPVMIVR